MYLHTKTWHTPVSMQTFRCMNNNMTVEMSVDLRQLSDWPKYFPTAFGPEATLRGETGKLNHMKTIIT